MTEPGHTGPPKQAGRSPGERVIVLRLSRVSAGFWVLMLAALAGVIASFLPWVSGLVSRSGLDYDGWETLALSVGIAALALGARKKNGLHIFAAGCGLIVLVIAIYDGVHLQNLINSGGEFVKALESVGVGVYLAGIAGAVATAAALWQWWTVRTAAAQADRAAYAAAVEELDRESPEPGSEETAERS
jgi:hypothetical protein